MDDMKTGKIKIAFVGGGTLGPVTPLLAVLRYMKKNKPNVEFIWLGTKYGPEKALLQKDLPFYDIPTAKLPRYPSFQWLSFPIKYFMAKYIARKILKEEKPDIVVGAGGFTQVPVILSANKQGIPSAIHQLDLVIGMSNKMIARKTISVTTSFDYEERVFPEPVESYQAATPVRFVKNDLVLKDQAAEHFGLDSSKPIIFVMGGGTGALSVNKAIGELLDVLLEHTQIIHSTGRGKKETESRPGYFVTEFLSDDSITAYSAADIVVTRAGMGAISECSALEKPMILIPLPNSPQEQNAEQLGKQDGALIVHQDVNFTSELLGAIRRLLKDVYMRDEFVMVAKDVIPTDDGKELAEIILKHIQ